MRGKTMERRESVYIEEVWFNDIDARLKPTDYPLERNVAEERLRDAYIEGERPSLYYERIEWPVTSRDDFMEKLRRARGMPMETERMEAPAELHTDVESPESPAMVIARRIAGEPESRLPIEHTETEMEIQRSESDAMIRARELAGEGEPMRTVEVERVVWFNDIDSRLRPTDYPLDRRTAEMRLQDAYIEGERPSLYYDRVEWPVTSREDFIEKLRRAREKV